MVKKKIIFKTVQLPEIPVWCYSIKGGHVTILENQSCTVAKPRVIIITIPILKNVY